MDELPPFLGRLLAEAEAVVNPNQIKLIPARLDYQAAAAIRIEGLFFE